MTLIQILKSLKNFMTTVAAPCVSCWKSLREQSNSQSSSQHLILSPVQLSENSDLKHAVSAGRIELCSHSSLHFALQFLLILATVLPEVDVQYEIVRIVFCCEPFIDLSKSDPKAKAMIVSTAFQLIDIMKKRSMDTTEPYSSLQTIIRALLTEHERICEMLSAPLHPKEGVHWDPSMFGTSSESVTYLKMLQTSIVITVDLALTHIQRLMCLSLSDGDALTTEGIAFWIETALPLVGVKTGVPPDLKEAALNVLMVGLGIVQRVYKDDKLKQSIQFFMEQVVPVLDSYISWHIPQRSHQQQSLKRTEAAKELCVQKLLHKLTECQAVCRSGFGRGCPVGW